MIGNNPGFVSADDPATISIADEHPAKALLLEAVKRLDRNQPRVAVECLQDAMTAISEHDGLMMEF